MPRTSVLIITGTVGVGKSTIADEVFETLKQDSYPVALINLDELGYIHTSAKHDPHNTEFRLKNLAAIWKNYHDVGVSQLIIPYVLEDRRTVERFGEAIPNADIYVIRLDAPLTVIKERIRQRPLGGSAAWHLKRAAELLETFKRNQVENDVVETQGRQIQEVAEQVIAKWSGHIGENHSKAD